MNRHWLIAAMAVALLATTVATDAFAGGRRGSGSQVTAAGSASAVGRTKADTSVQTATARVGNATLSASMTSATADDRNAMGGGMSAAFGRHAGASTWSHSAADSVGGGWTGSVNGAFSHGSDGAMSYSNGGSWSGQ
jgi:hypothetical protein